MRHLLQGLADRLARHDPEVCGDAPLWIVNQVGENIARFLQGHPDPLSVEEVRRFLISGIRYVADDTVDDRDALLEAIGQVLDSLNGPPEDPQDL